MPLDSLSSLICDEACQKRKRTTIDVDYQLLVIGAGPHALSLLTKLIEPSKDYLEEHPANKNLFKISSNTGRVGAKYKLLPDHIFTQKDGIMLLDSILGIYPIMVIFFCISNRICMTNLPSSKHFISYEYRLQFIRIFSTVFIS